jgi:hypothetical protein
VIFICIRKTLDWANEAEFWSQLPREFEPTVKVWNQTFNIPYHLFRHRVREISRLNIAAVQNAVCLDWKDVPDGELVLPMDDDDWFAEDVGIALEKARDARRHGYRWASSFLEVPIDFGHRLYLLKRRLLRTPPKWICTTNNYAVLKSHDSEPLFRSHIRASEWFQSHPESVAEVGKGLSMMNRTLASRTSLGLMRPETCKVISHRKLLHKYWGYRALYRPPPAKELAWCGPYVRMMDELMDELLPA